MSITLKGTGKQMPAVGFGLWKVTKATCADTVYKAIQAGYRLFDGASDYGNEKEAGDGIARAIKDGLVKREDLFITSKLWNSNHAKGDVRRFAEKGLADWGLEYFDLFLIHFPISLQNVAIEKKYPAEWQGLDGNVNLDKIPIQETYQALEELVDAGLAKNIGVSNFSGALLIDVVRYARIPPAVLQIEHHPYLTQESLIRLTKALGIAVTAYSSFGPASFIELNMDRNIAPLFEHDTIVKIASAHNKTPAQVLLRWATQRGLAVIPKSNDPTRLVQNLDSTGFDLTEEELKIISGLDQNVRFNDPADIDPRLAIFA
jgi:D-xylose reductase